MTEAIDPQPGDRVLEIDADVAEDGGVAGIPMCNLGACHGEKAARRGYSAVPWFTARLLIPLGFKGGYSQRAERRRSKRNPTKHAPTIQTVYPADLTLAVR